MFSFHSSLGIDFRGDHINVAHLVRTFKGLTLADSAILEPFYEQESTLLERYKLLFEDLRRFLRDKRITPDSVVLGLPRKDHMIKFINIPHVPKDEVGKIIEYELDRLFPYPVEELFHDYRILGEDDSGLKVLIISIPKKNLDLLFENLQELGLKLSAINVASISLFNLYGFNKKLSNGGDAIFLNFENGCAEVTGCNKGEIFLTRYINLKPDKNKEENFDLLIKQIDQIEDQIKSQNSEDIPCKKVLSGKFEGYRDLLMDIGTKTNLEFEEFDPFVKIKKDIIENPNGKLTTAISLALQGLGNVKYNMNILPNAMRVKKRNYGPVVMIFLLTIILILVSGIMVRLSFRERIALKEIQKKSKNIALEADSVKGIRKKVQDYMNYIESFNE
ncbi:pilus assembly protein PilM, partial [bacterium]|nr:pilus assembly protein PilM [bacterium]